MLTELYQKAKSFVNDPTTQSVAKDVATYVAIALVATGVKIAVSALYVHLTGDNNAEIPETVEPVVETI